MQISKHFANLAGKSDQFIIEKTFLTEKLMQQVDRLYLVFDVTQNPALFVAREERTGGNWANEIPPVQNETSRLR